MATLFDDIAAGRPPKDYLTLAANCGRRASAAVSAGRFDDAWRLYHEQKSLYAQHANYLRFEPRDALRLNASVHENLANILRVEKKHDQAFIHILYWVIAQSHYPIRRHQQKLKAYFNRCGLKNTSLREIQTWSKSHMPIRDFFAAQSKATEWLNRG